MIFRECVLLGPFLSVEERRAFVESFHWKRGACCCKQYTSCCRVPVNTTISASPICPYLTIFRTASISSTIFRLYFSSPCRNSFHCKPCGVRCPVTPYVCSRSPTWSPQLQSRGQGVVGDDENNGPRWEEPKVPTKLYRTHHQRITFLRKEFHFLCSIPENE
jgi:hypothetical protein